MLLLFSSLSLVSGVRLASIPVVDFFPFFVTNHFFTAVSTNRLHSLHPSLSSSTPFIPRSRHPLPSSLALVIHSLHPSLSPSTPFIPRSRHPLPPNPSLSSSTPFIPRSRHPLPPNPSSRSPPIAVSVFLFSFYPPP